MNCRRRVPQFDEDDRAEIDEHPGEIAFGTRRRRHRRRKTGSARSPIRQWRRPTAWWRRTRRAEDRHSSTTIRRSRRAPRRANWQDRSSGTPDRGRRISGARLRGSKRRAESAIAMTPQKDPISALLCAITRQSTWSPTMALRATSSSLDSGKNQAPRTSASLTAPNRPALRPTKRRRRRAGAQGRRAPIAPRQGWPPQTEWRRESAARRASSRAAPNLTAEA